MRTIAVCVLLGAVFNPGTVLSQTDERSRIREELRKYEDELVELNRIVPNTPRSRAMSPSIAKSREREQLAFNGWASSNDPLLHAAIMKGSGLNAMLRVLGPVAHYRRMRSERNAEIVFPSLKTENSILQTDVTHLRLVPASAIGANGAIRLNQLPLDLEWPTAILQNWLADSKDILKQKDKFVAALSSESEVDVREVLDRAELLDSALELLQLKVIQKLRTVPSDSSLTAQKRTQVHRDLQAALRYLESQRATVDRFKNAPGEYKVSRFEGGSIEDFLDFCYLRGMVFQEAQPADREHYQKVFRRMQDYAHDVQFVEDWKSDLEQRLSELNPNDRQLLWRGTELNPPRSISRQPDGLVPLIRFYDHERNQHGYATTDAELQAWRSAPKVKEHGSIGFVSETELPGTIRIWRGVRKRDLRHFYYTTSSGRIANIEIDNENFSVFAWKKGGDGRVPVYGSTWTDEGDVFFDSQRGIVSKFAEDTKAALRVDRKPLGNGGPIFYVYPPTIEPNPQRSIAGKWWNGLDGDGRQMMTITQKGEEISVSCSYNRPGFGEITWRLTGMVSIEGQISGRLEHTKAPKGFQNQNHAAQVSADGDTITGTATLDGGTVADYVWTRVKENVPK